MSIKCLLCGEEFQIVNWMHLKSRHGISVLEYEKMFPGVQIASEEFKDGISEVWMAKPQEEKEHHRRKCGEASDKRWSDPLAHLRASEVTARSAKEVWDSYSPEEKALRLSSGLHRPDSLLASQKANRGSRNSFEEELVRYLEEDFPGVFTWNRDMTKTIGGRFPDFFSDENQIVVECFGSHWHSFDPDDEERKIEHYRKYGFSCVVIWAHGLMDLAIQWIDCRDQIRSLLKVPVC